MRAAIARIGVYLGHRRSDNVNSYLGLLADSVLSSQIGSVRAIDYGFKYLIKKSRNQRY